MGSNTSSLGLVLLVSLLRMLGVEDSMPVWMAVVADVGSGVACLERVVGAILIWCYGEFFEEYRRSVGRYLSADFWSMTVRSSLIVI